MQWFWEFFLRWSFNNEKSKNIIFCSSRLHSLEVDNLEKKVMKICYFFLKRLNINGMSFSFLKGSAEAEIGFYPKAQKWSSSAWASSSVQFLFIFSLINFPSIILWIYFFLLICKIKSKFRRFPPIQLWQY